jgi:hypothetical protein
MRKVSPEIEKTLSNLAQEVWGVKRTSAQNCACHNKPQGRGDFRDELSWKEFGISGLCQQEQDNFFE